MSSQPNGPPYAPTIAVVGGVPTIGTDVPIASVFIFLFLTAAIGHMTIFQVNRRRGHNFLMSALMFGFCMARVMTMVLRIVWAVYPHDVQIAIAAQIFVSVGVLILFIVNLIFAQRILRAAHPHFGWNKAISIIFKLLYALIAVIIASVITAIIQSYYTLNMHIRKIDRDIQMGASSYLMFFCFLPIPLVIGALIIPRKNRVEKFGTGRWRSKISILLTSATLLCLGASFRTGTLYKNPRPLNDPAWYQAKWCFYFFNFVIETIVIYLYLLLRVDQRFHIPDGSKSPGDYDPSRHSEQQDEPQERTSFSPLRRSRVPSEEEVFDDMPVEQEKETEVENRV